MKNKYQVRLIKWDRISQLEYQINETIKEMEEQGYNLKDIKQFNYDKYIGYTFVVIFYKLK